MKIINEFVELVRKHPAGFGALWSFVFVVFFVGLVGSGFAPDSLTDIGKDKAVVLASATEQYDSVEVKPVTLGSFSEPRRIIIDSVGIDFVVVNPTSRDIADLDDALREGVVRYPGSGDLNDISNIFLFGHSSGLPVVKNKAYKAFNGIENLVEGEIIRVQSNSREYLYKVKRVSLVNAEEAWVELSDERKRLTLSTCNTFGRKQERFVVEADFLDSYPFL